MKQALLILWFIAIISTVSAVNMYYDVEEAEMVSTDTYSDVRTISEREEYTYIFSPAQSKHMTFTLSGSAAYKPRLSLWDVTEDELVKQVNGNYGQVITIDYVGTYSAGKPKQYLLAVETLNNNGQQFTLSYTTNPQNDLGTGTDGSYRFQNAVAVPGAGILQGFLGDEDVIDYFALTLKAGEDVSFRLSPANKDSLRFTLIDAEYITRVDQRAQLEGDVLTAAYSSAKDQTVWFSVEGRDVYTLDLQRSTMLGGVDEPPLPPPLPPVGPPSDDSSVKVGVDDTTSTPDETTGSGSSAAVGVIIIVIVLILAGLGVWYMKKNKTSSPKEKKTSSKATKKKPVNEDEEEKQDDDKD